MPNQKIKTKLTKKKKSLYNFSDDSDEEFSSYIQEDKALPSNCENQLNKTDLSKNSVSANHIKQEEANSSVSSLDSFVEVAEVSIQTSLNNSVKYTDDTVWQIESDLKQNQISANELDHVGKEVTSSPVSLSDSYVQVLDVSIQTSLDNSVKFPDVVNTVEPIDGNLSQNLFLENKVNHIKQEEADSSVTDSDSYVQVADVSMQTSLNNSVKLADVVNKFEAFKENLSGSNSCCLNEDADISFQFNANRISNPYRDEICNSKDSGIGTGNFKGIQLTRVLAYDTDEEKSCSVNSPQATSLTINETDSENDEPVEQRESIHTTSNHHNGKARLKEINNILGKMETMSITRSKQDSSSSDDEFESFLNGIKKSMAVKDRNSQGNSKPSLQNFIVNDSDIDYYSDEDSDELFYIKVTKDLRKKEKSCSYDFDASSSSDDGLSPDSLSAEDKKSTCTSLRNSNIGKVTSTAQGKGICPRDFSQPQSMPRIARAELRKEKAFWNQTSVFKRENKLKDTDSDKAIDEDHLDDNKHFLQSLSSDYPDIKRHPKASRFCKCFKETKLELAQHLHNIFNEVIFEEKLPKDFKIEWNPRYTKTAGTFYYKGTQSNFTAQVTLSVKVCDSPERVRDTLAHELCHAAVKLINGINEAHGPVWKSWAKKFYRKYPFMPVIVRCHDYTIKTKYTYQCTKCHYRIYRHSKSLDTDAKVCGHCRGKFEVFLTKDLDNSRASTATPRTPNKFALFVKECYSVKRKETGMRHGDIMKLLSKEFAEKNSLHDH